MKYNDARTIIDFAVAGGQNRMAYTYALCYLAQSSKWVASVDAVRLMTNMPDDQRLVDNPQATNSRRVFRWLIDNGYAKYRREHKLAEYQLTRKGKALGQSLGCVYK